MKILIVITIVMLLGILIVVFASNTNKKKQHSDFDTDLRRFRDNKAYRNDLYQQIHVDFRPYIERLYQAIDELFEKAKQQTNEINRTQYNFMINLLDKADDIEHQIETYWFSKKFNKDFSYYISLHYASHLLGEAIKAEQERIRDVFVELKKEQEKLGKTIDTAQKRQEHLQGKERWETSARIGEMCEVHKNISNIKSEVGAINTRYLNRVKQQDIKTGKRRDFIGANFGERGKRWRVRIMSRHQNANINQK